MSESTRLHRWIRSVAVGLALVFTSLGWTSQTAAMCQLAPPEDAFGCFYDAYGQCCVVQEFRGEDQCYIGYCMDFATCSWEVLIHMGCS